MALITARSEILATLEDTNEQLARVPIFEGGRQGAGRNITRELLRVARLLESLTVESYAKEQPTTMRLRLGTSAIDALSFQTNPYDFEVARPHTIEPGDTDELDKGVYTLDTVDKAAVELRFILRSLQPPYDPQAPCEPYFGHLRYVRLSDMAKAVQQTGAYLEINPHYPADGEDLPTDSLESA
jgi:hypothetical protein